MKDGKITVRPPRNKKPKNRNTSRSSTPREGGFRPKPKHAVKNTQSSTAQKETSLEPRIRKTGLRPSENLPIILETLPDANYALLDTGDGLKLEQYGDVRLIRPEQQAIWGRSQSDKEWDAATAIFTGDTDEEGMGRWRFTDDRTNETWPMAFDGVPYFGRFTSFRHVGVASLVAANAGAHVTHVDASKKAIGWARENQNFAKLDDKPIRWICEDAMKFVQREVRRGNKYDIILLDPPAYGRGPNGEVWQLFDHLPDMIDGCRDLLSDEPEMMVLTAYAIRASFFAIHEVVMDSFTDFKLKGSVQSGELIIREKHRYLEKKRHREETNSFIAEGMKLIIDALELGWNLKTLIFANSQKDNDTVQKLASRCIDDGADVLIVPEKVLGAVTRRDNPQMVIGIFSRRFIDSNTIKPSDEDVWIALDRVRDPGNLGTIMRTADAVGAKGIILIGETTDPFATETVRATMGSIFAMPICRMDEGSFIDFAEKWSGLVVGTHLEGSVDYRSPNYDGKPTLLIMGNEQSGMPPNLVDTCQQLIRIPQVGRADSLNLAIATGVCLYEIRRHNLSLTQEA
ncbi:putative tRNA/rRNA methyltransferase YsgA [Nymphon striatum]|nr:putative tRNA/rRNA methyltransferase YsgA [Nymphon striatum]